MKDLTCSQTKKAYKILNVLCKNGNMDVNEMYSMFESKDIAESICSFLYSKKMIIMFEESHGICSLRKSDLTCIALKNRLLSHNPNPLSKLLFKNLILRVIEIIVAIYGFLKIIEFIFKIDIPIF